jgi:hypothetical protein
MAPLAVNEFGVYDAFNYLQVGAGCPETSEGRDEVDRAGRGQPRAVVVGAPDDVCRLHGGDFSKHKPDLKNSLVKAIKDVTFRSGQRR